MTRITTSALVLGLALSASAAPPPVKVGQAAPRPEDVSTIDGMIKAFYDVISGPAGATRDWARDRTLYIPDVRFVSMSVGKDGKPHAEVSSHQQYVERTDPFFVKEGFYEIEVHRETFRFGNIAHVLSSYESRKTPGGPVTSRGINSVELFFDGTRWWIASAIWDSERPDNPIPAQMLPPSGRQVTPEKAR